MPIPEKIANAPQIKQGLELYLFAYFDLSSERTMDGQIPWSRIELYCEKNGFDEDQSENTHYFVSRMDAARAAFYSRGE